MRKHKNTLRNFETKNSFSVFQDFTEDEIEVIVMLKNAEADKKKKCKNCNFKTRCYINPKLCKARGKFCYTCLKPNHFPKSKSCFRARKDKFKMKGFQKKIKHGCETLRNFLKAKHYHIKSEKIPFDEP